MHWAHALDGWVGENGFRKGADCDGARDCFNDENELAQLYLKVRTHTS